MPLHLSLSTNLFKCAALGLTDDEAVDEFTRVVCVGLLAVPSESTREGVTE
jgi:hypothetical protein